jgi:hypothetical protein
MKEALICILQAAQQSGVVPSSCVSGIAVVGVCGERPVTLMPTHADPQAGRTFGELHEFRKQVNLR